MDETVTSPAERSGETIGAWSIALMSAALLTILLLRPVWDVDIFWQLKLGEMILARGPVAQEPFAATHLGEPLPAIAWLGQVVMAKVRLLSGWTGLRVFDAICWLGGFLLAAAACRRRGSSAAAIVVALGIAFFVAFPTASIRPQTFAVLGFGALLAVLRLELRPWRTSYGVVPLLLLWQNLHPSVSIAAVTLGTYAAVDWARWLLRKRSPPWETSTLTLVAAAAVLATPDGWSALQLAADNASASTAMGVSEWLPLWDSVNRGAAVPFALVCLAVAGLVGFNRHRIDPRELAVAIVFLAMTVFVNRFVLFWALALIPVIARTLTRGAAGRRSLGFQTPLLLGVTAVVTPIQHPTEFSPTLPLAAIARLQREQVAGVVFAPAPWGGPLIDIGHPRWQVAYDGRLYRYTPEEWRFYSEIGRNKVSLAQVEQRYRPVAFVLEPRRHTALIGELRASPDWTQIWSDPAAVVFRRKRPSAP